MTHTYVPCERGTLKGTLVFLRVSYALSELHVRWGPCHYGARIVLGLGPGQGGQGSAGGRGGLKGGFKSGCNRRYWRPESGYSSRAGGCKTVEGQRGN